MITQTTTTSFVAECLEGIHDILTDDLRLALYDDTADLSADTEVYTTTGEIVDANYTAGGELVTDVTIGMATGKVFVSFTPPVWDPATFTARGALLYNASKANRSMAVLDFGSDKTAVSRFTLTMPPNTADSALIRFKQEATA